jgi:hypothetical protein
MNKQSIIETIINHKPYKRYCYKLCNGRDIHNDLYQEFFILVAKKTEDVLISIFNTGYIEQYCLSIIYNLNKQRNRFIKIKGEDNTLLEHCNTFFELGNNIENDDYNHHIDTNFSNVMNFLDKAKHINTSDIILLYESLDGNIKEMSRNTKIPYRTLIDKRLRLIKKIKDNVRLSENTN